MYNKILKIVATYYKIFFRAEYYGVENVPLTGPMLICINHKSNNDPVIAASGIHRRIRFMAKKELFSIPLLSQAVKYLGAFPIDRKISDLGAVRAAFTILKGGDGLMMFPEGRRNKEFMPQGVKPGAATIAYKAGVPILPVYIEGKFRIFGKIRIYYGKPVLPETIGDALKVAAADHENKNTIISTFLYDSIMGAKEDCLNGQGCPC